jgi:myo-inositol-1(or 4)-monophosphatase
VTEINQLLEIVRDIAVSANATLECLKKSGSKKYKFNRTIPKEMKSDIDEILESEILKKLRPIGIPILSEESGSIEGEIKSGLRFVVDPLDGTVNFIRDLGPSSVSISLMHNNEPIFGILVIHPSGDIAWGGKNIGSFYNGNPLSVSKNINKIESVLCTGIPSRLDMNDNKQVSEYIQYLGSFGKVRMLGSASISLLKIAMGSADLYMEREIMLWDVAAGLAIVEGAGGVFNMSKGKSVNSYNVMASNGVINE